MTHGARVSVVTDEHGKTQTMPLSEQQASALPAVEWLIGGERRSGRTIVFAIAIIRSACRNPGIPVRFTDHHFSQEAISNVRHLVRGLLNSSLVPEYASVNIFQDRLVIHSQEPFEWEPNLDFLGENPLDPPPEYPPPFVSPRIQRGGVLVQEVTSVSARLIEAALINKEEFTYQKPKSALQRILDDEL